MSRPELNDIHRYGYPTQPATTSTSTSNSGQSPFLGTFDDLGQLEGHLFRRRCNDMDDYYYQRIQSHAGTSTVDPRLLMLLEFSRELYSRRSELFEKIFPGLHDEFIELPKRIDAMLLQGEFNNFPQTQVRSLQRSLSVGSPRTPSSTRGEEDLRLQRFKVRTLVVGGGEPGDRGGSSGGQSQSDTKNGGGAK
ncbi:hypothetical protein HS088_TW09G00650 [Tripterygium wilfordii]|uniref:Uncharacterized protein n=1 Tax=Tripterygium wilfordii TaxID=458696 RepID=A0A7J7D8M0_TRIWF|nr:hypothetical protein HS088_TW09G00650 [Tripterygium wilfordii]